MTDNTQPEALRALAESVAWTGRWYDAGCNTVHCTYDKEDSIEHDEIAHPVPLGVSGYIAAAHPQAVIALLDRIAELEAQLEAIGAGGVSGPLMGKPQEMPDLSALTERGAKAWAGVDAQGLREGAASAGSEPVATVFTMEALAPGGGVKYHATVHKPLPAGTKLYLHPSPPEGMVGGWMPIETAPKDGTAILLGSRGGSWIGKWLPVYVSGYRPENPWSSLMLNHDHMGEKWCKPTHWMPLPPPPTSSADSRKGE